MNPIELDQQIATAINSRLPYAAIELMCEHSTPKHLVWWGCMCAWSMWRPIPPQTEEESLSIASRWVFEGNDEQRMLAASRAESAHSGLCKWLLKATVNSGGSLAIEGQPVRQPTPNFSGRFIFGFVHQLMSLSPPAKRPVIAQSFAQLARQAIAEPLPSVDQIQGSRASHE